MALEEIKDHFGPGGIDTFVRAYGKVGAITDDTQMTLFTAEGLVLSKTREAEGPASDQVTLSVYHAYLRAVSGQTGARSFNRGNCRRPFCAGF